MPLARSGSTSAYSTTMAAVKTYVTPPLSTALPQPDGTATAGSAVLASRGDHIHPTDTSRLALSGGTLTGPLTLAADGTAALHAVTKQQLDALTTAAGYAPLASPAFTGNPTAPTATAGDNDATIATTQFVQSAIAPYANNAGRNIIHNGRFDVAQRGAGPFTAANVYTLDRWSMNFSLDTMSVTQAPLSDTQRTQIGDESAFVCIANAFTGNAGAASFNIITQMIEDVRRLAGKTITVSFYAFANSGTPKLGVSLDQLFGTGGSAAVIGNGQAVTLSTTWARYTLTFSVASVSGKTVTAADSKTGLNFWFSSGATQAARAGNIGVQSATIGIWGVQLEIGSVATPLARRDPADELALCQRFYQVLAHIQFGSYSPGGGIIWNTASCPVQMRATPSVTIVNTAYSSGASNLTLDAASVNQVSTHFTPGTGASWCVGDYLLSADL